MQVSNITIRKSLGEMLVEEKLITEDQLKSVLELQKNQGGHLNDLLVSRGLVKPEDITAILSIHLNLPYIDLQRHKVQKDALKLVPEEIARKHILIPLDIVNDSLVLVMADPQDIQTIQDIKALVKINVEVALGLKADIEQAIDMNYRSIAEIEKQLREYAPPVIEKSRLTEELVARTPIAQTVDLIISQAVRDRASDIHIEPQEDRLRVRFRIDGILYDMFALPLSVHGAMVSRIKILAEMNIAESRRPQDGQMVFKVGDKSIDIRVASMAVQNGERLTLRLLDKSLSLISLDRLGLNSKHHKIFSEIIKNPYGLVLVGGPTGSGKTTTLYALINCFNRVERNIMTIEDPVEYHFKDINQTQVNQKAGITYASGLRSLMRHDPNVIMVGEIRDKETAAIAVQASLTGQLVFSSIHANNAVGVLFRLLDLGIEPFLITTTLVAITSQRLVRKLCPHCKVGYKPSEQDRAILDPILGNTPEILYKPGSGCNLCSNTGFIGRTGIYEILLISDNLRKMVIDNSNAIDIEAQAYKEGLVSMRHDGMRKVSQGLVSIEEILRCLYR